MLKKVLDTIKNLIKNIIIIIPFILVVLILNNGVYENTIKEKNKMINQSKMIIETCEKNNLDDPLCENIKKVDIYNYKYGSSIVIFSNSLSNNIYMRNLDDYFPLMIFLLCGIGSFNIIKSGIFKYILQRKKYKNFIIKELLKSYTKPILLSLTFIIFIIMCLIIADLPFGYSQMYGDTKPVLDEFFAKFNYSIYFVFILNIILYSIFLSNVFWFFAKSGYNFILTIIESFVFVKIFNIICTTISPIFSFFNYDIANVLSTSIISNTLAVSQLVSIVYMLLLVISSYIALFYRYKDKESLVMSCEK